MLSEEQIQQLERAYETLSELGIAGGWTEYVDKAHHNLALVILVERARLKRGIT